MKILIAALLGMLVATAATAAQYNYMAPEELRQRIDSNDNILIVDIQVEEEFRQHHIPGSLATYAYPVKSNEQRTRLDPIVNLQQNGSTPVVIVCPRGAGGAKRTYDYLTANGILEYRLSILEKGMSGWKYEDMTTTFN